MTLQRWGYDGPTSFDSRANYMGADLRDRLMVPVSQNRDSGPLARSNFRVALDLLGGESDTVEVHRFGHWACGWYELILIVPGSPAQSIAEDIARRLDNYPVLNEDDWSALEWEEMTESWSRMSLRERIELLARFGASIFAARSDAIPDVQGVEDSLRPDE